MKARLTNEAIPATIGTVICPMCHTSAPLPQSALDAGADWCCVRCGQRWDAPRLVTVANYAAWVENHDAAGSRVAAP